jgi:hypothetical protein
MTSFYRFRGLLAIFVAGASVTGLYGQISGDIEVKALDRSGAAVVGAKVTARSHETGTERSATTSGDGSVRLTLLNIGKYEVQVDAQGFAVFKIPVDVNSGRVSDVRATMEIVRHAGGCCHGSSPAD